MSAEKLTILALAVLVAICPGEYAVSDDKQIVLTDEIITCFFGDDRKLDDESEEEFLLQYVRLVLEGAAKQELENVLAQKCDRGQNASVKKSRKLEISGYDMEEPGANIRDYDVRFTLAKGPDISIPLFNDAESLKWSTSFELFASRFELEGVEENQDRNSFGLNIGSLKYLRWTEFQPFLELGYFYLDKEISSTTTGLLTEDSNTHNFSFKIGADISPWEKTQIVIEHGVGTEGIFGPKTAAKTGAKFEVTW